MIKEQVVAVTVVTVADGEVKRACSCLSHGRVYGWIRNAT